ncbi:leucyl aminopeptidase [Streptosporangium sp. NPDC051022]|uniref:leucyl aminopeptidase n=1 Tax=Streptosporangium sp. NPDC051022 TaxID=3155752 RepID=UPI0034428F80
MTEWQWIQGFAEQFRRCGVHEGEPVTILSETRSRASLVETSLLAAQSLGARVCQVVMPTPANPGPVAIRSTGASVALRGHEAAIAALSAGGMVVDCTVEGLLHSVELPRILGSGSRVLMISNEHPENFERFGPVPGLEDRVAKGKELIDAARTMRVTSAHGTDLTVDLSGAMRAGSTGLTDGPGSIAHWPGGLVIAFPARDTVNGTAVLAPGDINLTFKRYVERPVTLRFENDVLVAIEGDGVDAEMFRSYIAAWNEPEAYAVSHVGWGMNPAARWDYLELYDKGDVNGTEARAFAGNFLISTGANEVAGRYTAGHFDLPMRGCTVTLDGTPVVSEGVLAGELAP